MGYEKNKGPQKEIKITIILGGLKGVCKLYDLDVEKKGCNL